MYSRPRASQHANPAASQALSNEASSSPRIGVEDSTMSGHEPGSFLRGGERETVGTSRPSLCRSSGSTRLPPDGGGGGGGSSSSGARRSSRPGPASSSSSSRRTAAALSIYTDDDPSMRAGTTENVVTTKRQRRDSEPVLEWAAQRFCVEAVDDEEVGMDGRPLCSTVTPGGGASREHSLRSEPTPRPARQHTVLTSTPAFLRAERRGHSPAAASDGSPPRRPDLSYVLPNSAEPTPPRVGCPSICMSTILPASPLRYPSEASESGLEPHWQTADRRAAPRREPPTSTASLGSTAPPEEDDDPLAFLGPRASRASGGAPLQPVAKVAYLSTLSSSLASLASSGGSSSIPHPSRPMTTEHTASLRRSPTLLEPDVSPIVEDSVARRRRGYQGGRTTPDLGRTARPLNFSVGGPENAARARRREGGVKPPQTALRHTPRVVREEEELHLGDTWWLRSRWLFPRIGRTSRRLFLLCLVLLYFLMVGATVNPLWLGGGGMSGHPDELLSSLYVSSAVQLESLYRVPAGSLRHEEVALLHRRVLSESIERLERSTQHVKGGGPHSTHEARLAYYRQMIVAYERVRHQSRLFARSRDGSIWRRWVTYPMSDVYDYGLVRGGIVESITLALRNRSWHGFLSRLRNTIACAMQHEGLPCPSVEVVEMQMIGQLEQPYDEVNWRLESAEKQRWRVTELAKLHPDWSSEVYLECLLGFMRNASRSEIRMST